MVTKLTQSAVRIYGALAALGNDSGSVMESLVPFFDPILREHAGEKLDPVQIAKEIQSRYKWNFNADVVESFVPYLMKHGLLTADVHNSKDTTYTIIIRNTERALDPTSPIDKELWRIASDFKAFSESLSPLTTIPRKVDEFADILIEWLLYVEAFSEENTNFTTQTKKDEDGTLVQSTKIPHTTSLKDEEQFLCARFVQHAVDQDNENAEVLARIASIGLLTEVVQDFVKPLNTIERTDLVVYLDGPVAMDLLGLSGKASKDITAPLVSELVRMGASVRIFVQSIEEIQRTIKAVLDSPEPIGTIAQAMRRGDMLKDYIVGVAKDPTRFLEKYDVQATYRTLDQTPSEHKYFDEDQRQDLYAQLRYTENHHAREHDADITALVMRQRKHRTAQDVFSSKVVIVTRNGVLAQIVRKTLRETIGYPTSVVPPVIHRRALATAMWLRTGMGAKDLTIPKRLLLASCEPVLAIRPNVVAAVKRMTDATGDEDKAKQLDLLVSTPRSTQALMDKTLGDINVITEENFAELWDGMLHPHIEKEREIRRSELKALNAKNQERLSTERKKRSALEKESRDRYAALNMQYAAKLDEDRVAVEALCEEVRLQLRKKQRLRMLAGVCVALLFTVPILFDTSVLVRTAAFAIGLILAYLTITGGQLLKIRISSDKAIESLRRTAAQRGMTPKIDAVEISWSGESFAVSEKHNLDVIERSELFPSDC